jgi:hypothetical protein
MRKCDIPSVSELIPCFEASSWFGVAMPPEIIELLNREINAGLADATSLLDEEGFFLEFASLHLVPHPARSRAATGPGEFRIFLAAVLRGDLAALQLRTLAARRTAASLPIPDAGTPSQAGELLIADVTLSRSSIRASSDSLARLLGRAMGISSKIGMPVYA